MKLNMAVTKTIAIVAVVAGVTNGVQFFISSKLNEKSEAKYLSQINQLNATIEAIGPLVDCWTVTEKSKADKGLTVLESDLEKIKIPESCVQSNYILDKYDVIGKFYKVDLNNGTPLTKDMFMDSELDDTTRELDLTADVFPVGVKVGDYLDLRLLYPKGEDYIVLSHLRVNEINGDTIKCALDEQQILFYDSATVENFLNKSKGSMTYFAKYTEPGIQEPAKITYSVPQSIMNLLDSNPNIVKDISNGSVNRDVIDSNASAIDDETGGVLSGGRTELIAKIQTAKELYDSMQIEMQAQSGFEDSSSSEEDEQPFGATDANGLPVTDAVDLSEADNGGVE